MVHGSEQVVRVEHASSVLFAGDFGSLSVDDVLAIFDDVPSSTVALSHLEGDGVAVIELLVSSGLVASKGEATRLIRSGGVYVNNRRVADEKGRLRVADAVEGRLFVLRKGARLNHIVRVF
jgi:tyrosyl-tRNA synthetase